MQQNEGNSSIRGVVTALFVVWFPSIHWELIRSTGDFLEEVKQRNVKDFGGPSVFTEIKQR